MRREYIPILVEGPEKKEIWKMDISNLSITELIKLRNSLQYYNFHKTIQALDSAIKKDIGTVVRTHHISENNHMRNYKKMKKELKQRKKTKSRRR